MSKLYQKYKIEKTDGTPVDPEAFYFVLRFDTDAFARAAGWFYAQSIRKSDPQFANKLLDYISAAIQQAERGEMSAVNDE